MFAAVAIMAIMEANPDSDVMRVWVLLNDLSEQLSQNRNASISLHTVTGGVKVRARIRRAALYLTIYVFRHIIDSGNTLPNWVCTKTVRN